MAILWNIMCLYVINNKQEWDVLIFVICLYKKKKKCFSSLTLVTVRISYHPEELLLLGHALI